jgi:hypothetical protein
MVYPGLSLRSNRWAEISQRLRRNYPDKDERRAAKGNDRGIVRR